MENASQTLQSFTNPSAIDTSGNGDLAIEITEDEMAMFSEKKPTQNNKKTTKEEDIVVRYSAPAASQVVDQQTEPGYATVNELARIQEKKGKKKDRMVSSKSLQKKKKEEQSKAQPSPKLGGSELGFKPQFHTNPLLKMGGSIPPTPPPTPATAASIAPSDESKMI